MSTNKISIPNWSEKRHMPYGVIQANSCENLQWVVDDIMQNGTSLQYENWMAEIKDDIRSYLESASWLDGIDGKDLDDKVEAVFDSLDLEAPEWEEEEYETGDALLGYLGGAPLIWVTDSAWVAKCRQCSPCVPHAGDLDSPAEDGNEALCLEPDIMQHVANESGDTYHMRNLETGEVRVISPVNPVDSDE